MAVVPPKVMPPAPPVPSVMLPERVRTRVRPTDPPRTAVPVALLPRVTGAEMVDVPDANWTTALPGAMLIVPGPATMVVATGSSSTTLPTAVPRFRVPVIGFVVAATPRLTNENPRVVSNVSVPPLTLSVPIELLNGSRVRVPVPTLVTGVVPDPERAPVKATALAPVSNVPPLAPSVTALAEVKDPVVWSVPPLTVSVPVPRFASADTWTRPPLMVVPPEKVLDVPSTRVPAPLLVRVPAPPIEPPEKLYVPLALVTFTLPGLTPFVGSTTTFAVPAVMPAWVKLTVFPLAKATSLAVPLSMKFMTVAAVVKAVLAVPPAVAVGS